MKSRTTASRTTAQTRRAAVAKLPPKRPAPAADEVLDSPLYGVAMLRMALELKRPESGTFEEILGRVLTRMRLEEAPFRRYLAKNGGLLLSLRRA